MPELALDGTHLLLEEVLTLLLIHLQLSLGQDLVTQLGLPDLTLDERQDKHRPRTEVLGTEQLLTYLNRHVHD